MTAPRSRPTSRFAVVTLLAAIAASVLPVTPASAQATCPVTSADQAIDSEEFEMLQRVNDYRDTNGFARLTLQPDVTRAASWFSRSMATGDYFPANHVDSNGRDVPSRLSWCGTAFIYWAENIYAGSGDALDAFNWWINSAPHLANIRSTTVFSVGISRAFNASSTYGWYWTLDLTDTPAEPVADFDNDNDSDRAVFRPSNNTWFVQGSAPVSFGQAADIPVPADYDGDGDADIAVFRPSVGGWFIMGSPTVFLGQNGDIPVPADYDGDGAVDPAVFRPSVGGWYIDGASPVFWGLNGDIPVPGNYDGEVGEDIAVFRPSVGGWYRSNGATVFHGLNGDIPVPANYDGDFDDEVAVYRPSVGGWYINGASTTFFGLNGDFPVPGNLDGGFEDDIAVFRRTVGGWYLSGGSTVFFGLPGDIPLLLPHHIQRFFTFAGP
ncbi:MAG: CAP domain-containing protein [Acidimicrobiales bacterium]